MSKPNSSKNNTSKPNSSKRIQLEVHKFIHKII